MGPVRQGDGNSIVLSPPMGIMASRRDHPDSATIVCASAYSVYAVNSHSSVRSKARYTDKNEVDVDDDNDNGTVVAARTGRYAANSFFSEGLAKGVIHHRKPCNGDIFRRRIRCNCKAIRDHGNYPI